MGVALITPSRKMTALIMMRYFVWLITSFKMEQTFYACWEPRLKPRL